MDHILALIWLDVFDPTLWATVVTATAPNVNPFCFVIRAAIVIDELTLGHKPSST
jgi:hypothetical protein